MVQQGSQECGWGEAEPLPKAMGLEGCLETGQCLQLESRNGNGEESFSHLPAFELSRVMHCTHIL